MLKHRKFCPKKGNTLYSERGQTGEEVAQRGRAVSILGDIQNPGGCDHEQPAAAGPAGAGGLDSLATCASA